MKDTQEEAVIGNAAAELLYLHEKALEKAETTLPPIIAEMRRLVAVMRGLPAYEITDTAWHLDSMEEDLKALWDIHVEEPRRAEEAEQARHEDVMENGSYAERRHEVLGDVTCPLCMRK